jgi:trehalose transport system permease protein
MSTGKANGGERDAVLSGRCIERVVTVTMADAWKVTPLVMLILLAGLQAIPRELYEAARTDGAGPWQQFWRITLAYSLARLPVRWRYGILLSLLLCRMLPEVSVALPIAVIFLRWGLLDTALGLILAHLTIALPVATWVLTTTFSSIPREVQEAAAVDGCGAWRTLISIILPLALPGLAVCGLLVWLLSWEEFTLATYLTLGAKTMPLQVYYYLYQGNWFDTAVAATLMTVPVLVLSTFLQRYLRETSLAGVMR